MNMKRFSLYLALVGGLLGGLAANRLYDRCLCPEAAFFRRAAGCSDQWAQQMRQGGQPLIVWAGGSEIRAGIDPEALWKSYGIRSVNAAGQAGFGMPANFALALPYLQKGDTLIVACLGVDEVFASGAKFAWERAGMQMFESGLVPCNADTLRKIFLGNSGEFCMHLSKRLVHPLQAPYKYETASVLHPGGWMEVQVSEMQGSSVPTFGRLDGVNLPPLPESYMQLMRTLKAYTEARGVKFACMLPVEYRHSNDRPVRARMVLELLDMGIPVLRDPRFGAEPRTDFFADTGSHLNAAGVAEQTRLLGAALKADAWWKREDVAAYLRLRGWDEQGRWIRRSSYAPLSW